MKTPLLRHRIGWLLLLWLASVSALALATYSMRFLMALAGMSTP